MKKIMMLLLAVFIIAGVNAKENPASAEEEGVQKHALVIGNGNYVGMSPLANPVNDASDIAAVLERLGFNVEKLLNANLEQMEDAVLRLGKRLRESGDGYGFFFYAGHGVQSGGENFLIPVNANIPGENYLRNRAMSVQSVLDDLNDARNGLNVVVLDACRDNPFGWSRSGTRGLSVVTRQPAGSIIVYATSAGQQASDGDGRNGLFTSQLLKNLDDQSLEVMDVFRRTGNDVASASHNQQIPAIYSQAFKTAYLGTPPSAGTGAVAAAPPAAAAPSPMPLKTSKDKKEKIAEAAHYWSVGASVGSSFAAPWMIGTAHGTIAPFKYSFLEVGFDIGFLPGRSDVGYYSLYPYGHLAFFYPVIINKLGLYAGVGGGVYIVSYDIKDEGDYSKVFAAAAATAGVNILDMIDVSYTLRTNFSGVSHKASVGYTYRFK